jgi:hypothetical protein
MRSAQLAEQPRVLKLTETQPLGCDDSLGARIAARIRYTSPGVNDVRVAVKADTLDTVGSWSAVRLSGWEAGAHHTCGTQVEEFGADRERLLTMPPEQGANASRLEQSMRRARLVLVALISATVGAVRLYTAASAVLVARPAAIRTSWLVYRSSRHD